MEEKAKSGLKSALSFLEGDVVFYLAEAEKHETGAKAKASIRYTQLMTENLIKRIKKLVKEDMPIEKNKCGKCVYAGYCALASLRGYDPCDTFEKRQDLRQEEAERMYKVMEDIHRKRVKDIETDRLPPRRWGEIRMN